ncbi:UNVERIFIED_ORG: hypothetical protein GGD48_006235 [Rhizobium etli]
MTVTAILLDQSGWTSFEATLNHNQDNNLLTPKIIEQVRALGAQTILVEDEYVDRDFTDAFAAYYARLFKRHMLVSTQN